MDKKAKHALISAPFVPRRRRRSQARTKPATDVHPQVIDVRFDPSTFSDLQAEADLFFGSILPFWDRPTDLLSPLKSHRSSSTSSNRKRSSQWKFPIKLGIWTRLVSPPEHNPNNLRRRSSYAIEKNSAALSHRGSEQLDEYFDCSTSMLPTKASPLLNNRRLTKCSPPIIVDESNSVEF